MEKNDEGQFSTKYELSDAYGELFDEYSGWMTINTDKTTTIDRLKAGVRAWLYWCEDNDIQPYEARERQIRRYIQSMQKRGLAETTITRRVASVSKYYHFLLTDPMVEVELEENPTKEIKLRKDHSISNLSEYIRVLDNEGRDDIIALSYERIEPIFDHVPGQRDATRIRNELICRLLWQTAVRSEEMSRFRVDNIEWDDREIKIRSAKLNRKDHPDLYHRRVWWESNLDYLMHRWNSKRSQFIDKDDESPYLFITEDGTQMSPSYISRIVKDAAHNAEVNEPLTRNEDGEVKQWLYTAHRLRHSRITHLANNVPDLDLNFIRMMAGHVKFDTTLKYVKTDWQSAREAYDGALNK